MPAPILNKDQSPVHFEQHSYSLRSASLHPMKKSTQLSSMVMTILLLVLLAAVWIAFAPTMIGGWDSYVIVNGISMEPGFHRGDLVIVRAGSTYGVGDIVIYKNGEMNAFVIHRIIGMEQDHYVFKGDNN